MAAGSLHNVLRHMRRLVGAAAEPTDAALLERFVQRRDESAFVAILRAHGPLVLDVCRNVLGNEADAEDAFQATFLVLACKAAAIRKQEALASWLYGTAQRVALKVRTQAARRREYERQASTMNPVHRASATETPELRPELHEELGRLPEKYRVPLILCYLEGKSNEEAAQELGWPKGTVQGRLARARDMLHQRLQRRGVSLAAVAPAALLPATARAEVPRRLLEATLKNALLAAEGAHGLLAGVPATMAAIVRSVLRDMLLAKIRRAVVLLVVCVVGLGAGVATYTALASRQVVDQVASADPVGAAPEPPPMRRDDRGDELPAGARARLGTLRFLHQGPVYALAFSPDRKILASQGGDDLIRVWELSSGKEIWQRRLLAPPIPDQPLRPAGSAAETALLPGHPLAFSPDGRVLAVGTKSNTVALYDAASGKEIGALAGHEAAVTCLAFTAAGQLLSGSADKSIRMWDLASRKTVRQFVGHEGAVTSLAIDKHRVASGSSDQTARLWEIGTGREARKFQNQRSAIRTVALSPDGKTLVTGDAGWVPPRTEDVSAKATIRFWDIDAGTETGRLENLIGGVYSLAFAPDGKTLVAGIGDMTTRLWELPKKQEKARLGGFKGRAYVTNYPVYAVAYSPDGKTLASGSFDRRIRLIDAATTKERFDYAARQEPVAQLALSADSKSLAALTDYLRAPSTPSNSVHVWDLAAGKITTEFAGTNGPLCAIDFLGGGKSIVSASSYGPLQTWDIATGRPTREFGGDKLRASGLAVAVNTRIVAVGISDELNTTHVIRLFAGNTGKELGTLPVPAPAKHLVFSADGRVLAAVEDQNGGKRADRVHLWSIPSGKAIGTVEPDGRIAALAFSPDGKMLATGGDGKTLNLWEVTTAGERARWSTPDGVTALAFAPDGRTLAWAPGWSSAAENGTIRLAAVADGKEVRQFVGHQGAVTALAFTRDGKSLISASTDSTMLVWDVADRVLEVPFKAARAGESWDTIWSELAGADCTRSYQAMVRLRLMPADAVAALRTKVRPVAAVEGGLLERLVADLDSNDFAVREKASAELEKIGECAEPTLRSALEARPSLEMMRRLQDVLSKVVDAKPATDQLGALRTVEVLEHIGTPEARQLLEMLARGASSARLTREAQAALGRIANRSSAAR